MSSTFASGTPEGLRPAAAGFFFGMVVTAEGGRAGPGPGPPIGLTFLFAGLGWYVRYWRQGNADLEVTETVRTLMAEFPGVVHDWGGEAVLRLLDALDDQDDVQDVYVNANISDEIIAAID